MTEDRLYIYAFTWLELLKKAEWKKGYHHACLCYDTAEITGDATHHNKMWDKYADLSIYCQRRYEQAKVRTFFTNIKY